MATDSATQELPRRRTGRFISWVERHSISRIVLIGAFLYLLVSITVSAIEFIFHPAGKYLVLSDKGSAVSSFRDILYFNLTTVLTIGYGDFHPASYGRALSIIEAFVGVGLFSVFVAVITVKALLPPRDAIVFSKYAYYCTEPEKFLIVFVNTTKRNIGNVQISSYFKLGGDWLVKPSSTSPFITRSVQTFYVEPITNERLIAALREGDCLRVGIAGGLGFSNFSTSIQYSADNILVMPNRNKLIEFFEPLWEPDFKDALFKQMFHYQPKQMLTLKSFVEGVRKSGTISD